MQNRGETSFSDDLLIALKAAARDGVAFRLCVEACGGPQFRRSSRLRFFVHIAEKVST
jgi:hypothetical protein